MAEDGVVPVGDIERAVGTELKIDRDAGLVVRFEDVDETIVVEGGPVLCPIVQLNAVVVLVLIGKDQPLVLVGPVATGDELLFAVAIVRVLVRWALDESRLRMMDQRGVEMAPHVEVLAPAVDGMSPGISTRWQGRCDIELLRAWVEAIDGVVFAAAWAIDRLHLCVVKNAFLHEESAAGPPDEHVDGVVGVFATEAVQEDRLLVGFAIVVGVFKKDQVRLLGNEGASKTEFEAERQVEFVGEDRTSVGLAVAVGVFEDDDLIVRFHARQCVWVGRHRRDPQSSLRVEVDADRVAEFRKILLGSEEFHAEAFGNLEVLPFRGGRERG